MEKFVLFSNEHILIMVLGIIIGFVFLIMGGITNRKGFAKLSAVIIFILKISELAYRHLVLGKDIVQLLPFHLCNLALILVIVMMYTKSKNLFQISFFWAIGAPFAILTPDVTFGIGDFATISFFITHFYIVFAVAYAYIYFGFRPTIFGFVESFIALNIVAVLVYFINDALGTNYLFVNRVPGFNSPLKYFGEWPYYIVVVEVIYLVLGYLLYIPFKQKSIKYGKKFFR